MKKVLALVLTVVLVLTMSVSAFASTTGVGELHGPFTDPQHPGDINNWPLYNPGASGTVTGSAVGNPATLNHTRVEIANGIAWELAQRGIQVSDISGIIVSMNDNQYAAMEANLATAAGVLNDLGFTVAGTKWNAPLQADLTEDFVTSLVSAISFLVPAQMTLSYNANSFAINKDWITATFTVTNSNTYPGYSKWARQTVTVNWCYTHPWDPWNAGTTAPAPGTGTNESTGNPLGTQTGDNTVAVALVSLFAVAGVLAIAARKSRNVA